MQLLPVEVILELIQQVWLLTAAGPAESDREGQGRGEGRGGNWSETLKMLKIHIKKKNT